MKMKAITSTEIRKLVQAGNVTIGTERTLKNLKLGKLKTVLMSANCPEKVEKGLLHYSALSSAETVKLNYPNDELGVICKKPFSISVLGVLKD